MRNKLTRELHFEMPARREFVGLARLAVGGLALTLSFDDETIEDIKLALSEVCTLIVTGSSSEQAKLVISVALNPDDITIDIDARGAVIDLATLTPAIWANPHEPGFGLSIITTLMDQVQLVSDGDRHTVLRLRKFT